MRSSHNVCEIKPIYYTNDKALCQRMDDIVKTFERVKIKEDEWNNRLNAIQTMHGLVLGGCAQQKVFIQYLQGPLHTYICQQFTDPRSTIVKELGSTFSDMVASCGQSFESVMDFFMEDIIKLLGSTNSVMKECGHRCMMSILRNCSCNKTFPYLIKSVTTKGNSVYVRQRSAEYIRFVLIAQEFINQEYHLPSDKPNLLLIQLSEKNILLLEDNIISIMQDADQEVRTTGRQCYWLFNEIFPERTERIKTLIEYKILELLNTEKETLQSQINNHRQRIIDGNDAIAPPRLSSSKHLSSQSTLNTLSSSPRSMPSSPPSSQPLSCSQEPISLQPSPSFSAGSATVQTSSLPHPSSASSSLNDSHPNVRQASAITPPPPPPPPPPSAPLQLSPIDSHATTETSKTLIQISSRSHSPSLPSSFPSSLASSSESFHSIQNEDFQSISSAPFLPPHSCPLPPSPSLSLSPSTSPIPTFINSPSPSPPPPPPPLHLSTLSPTPFSNYTRSASSTPSSASPLPPPPSPPKSINCANLPLPPQQLPSEADIANKAVSPVPLPAIPTSAVQSTCLPTSSAPQNNVAKNADESSFHSAIPFSSNSFAKKVFEDSLQQSVIEPAKEAESSLTEDEARLLLTSTPTTQMNEDVFFSVVEAHFILPLQKHFAESRVSSISSVNSNNANNQEVIDSCERMFKLILSHHFPLLILPQKRTEDKDLLSFNSSSSSSDPSQPCSSFISSISSDSSSVHQTFSPCLLPLLQIFAYADDSAADSDSVLRISSLFDSFVVELVKNVGKTESSTSLQNENDDESAMQHDEHSAIEAATNLLHEFSEEPSRIEAMESSDFVASSSEQIKMVKTVLEAVHIQLEKCLKDNSNSLNANEDGNLESNSLVSAQKPSSSSSASASYPGESTSSQANSFQQHSPSNDKVVKRLLGFIVKIIEAFSESVSKSYLLNDISSSSSFSSSVKTDCFSSSDLPQNSVSEFISKIRSFLFYRFRNSILHLLSSSSSLLRMNVLDCVASILYKCTQMDLSPAIEPFSEAYKRLLKAHIQMKQSRQIVDGLL